jgi:hypothetical protein
LVAGAVAALALIPPVLISAPAPAGAATPSLRGDWHLDAITKGFGSNVGLSKDTTPDSTPNASNGVVNGAAVGRGVFNPQNVTYGALVFNPFDGSADNVDIANNAALSFGGEITVEAWINATNFATPPDSDGNILVVSKSGPGGQSFGLGVSNVESGPSNICPAAAGANAFFYVQTNNGAAITCSSTAVPVAQWVHLAGRYKPSLGITQIWVNGALVGVVGAAVPANSPMRTSSTNVHIGDRPWPQYRGSFNGAIDEVRIWSRALGSAVDGAGVAPEIEISADSARQTFGAGPADTGTDNPKPSAGGIVQPTKLDLVGSHVYTAEFSEFVGSVNPVTFNILALPSEASVTMIDPDNDGNIGEHVDISTIYNATLLCPTTGAANAGPTCFTAGGNHPGIAIDINNSGVFEAGERRGLQLTVLRNNPTQEAHLGLNLHLTDGSMLPVSVVIR